MRKMEGGVTAPRGFMAGGTACGIKRDTLDLGLLLSEREATSAGVFTTNMVKAAPVMVTSQQISKGRARAVVANSGNANACTGDRGMAHAWDMVRETARVFNLSDEDVLVCSTGVIGEQLPMSAVKGGIESLAALVSPDGGRDFARAIMTTDTMVKEVAFEVETSKGTFHVGGAAKGAGMIQPHMATMLAFITTDLEVNRSVLQTLLEEAVEKSFNRISVDGETSTNDTVLALANGASGVKGEGEGLGLFQEVLERICRILALMMVRDGEGATKLVKIEVKGALSDEEAQKTARKVANSLLVKTALYGEDPNWGRMMAAAGSAGSCMEPSRMNIWIGDVQVVQGGVGVEGAEKKAHGVMRQREYTITLDLGLGSGTNWIWTCDLTYDYIRINAEYKT